MPIIHELLEEKPLVKGEYWYILNFDWWKRWREVISKDDKKKQPGFFEPISNINLIDSTYTSIIYDYPIIKKSLKKDKDYVLVHKDLWDYIYNCYGGGPAIPCPIISLYKRLIIEVYPSILELILFVAEDSIKKIKVAASKSEKIVLLKERIFKHFQIDNVIQYKLYHSSGYNVGILIPDSFKNPILGEIEYNTVCSAYIINEQSLVLTPLSKDHTQKLLKSIKIKGYSQGLQNLTDSSPLNGTIGLYNLGNTCFLNVILQCLTHIPAFIHYFLTDHYKYDINTTNPLGHKGWLALEFETIVRALWFGDVKAEIPRRFLSVLRKIAPQFDGAEEHDAHELMTFLLDGLHEDLSRVLVRQNIQDPEFHSGADLKVSGEEAWLLYLKRNDSIIVDLFQGLLKSHIVCQTCLYDSIRFDPFMYLALPFPKSKRALQVKIVMESKIIDSIVIMDGNGTFKALKEELHNLVQIPVSYLIIAEVFKNTIQKIFPLAEKVSEISKTSMLIAYEVIFYPEVSKAQQILIKVFQNVASWCDLDNGKFDSKLHDCPFLLFIPRKIKLKQLEEYLKNRLNQLIDTPDEFLNKKFFLCRINRNTRLPEILLGEAEYLEFEPEDIVGLYWDKHQISCEAELPRFHKSIVHPQSEKNKELFMKPISIYDCLEAFSEKEVLDKENGYNCPKCKKPQMATRTLELWRLPEIFIVHLKRFRHVSIYVREKIDMLVEFPLENLEIVVNGIVYHYNLFAYANHMGLVSVGHYTAKASNHLTGKWYCFNDDVVMEMEAKSRIVSSSAYILFYELDKTVESNS